MAGYYYLVVSCLCLLGQSSVLFSLSRGLSETTSLPFKVCMRLYTLPSLNITCGIHWLCCFCFKQIFFFNLALSRFRLHGIRESLHAQLCMLFM